MQGVAAERGRSWRGRRATACRNITAQRLPEHAIEPQLARLAKVEIDHADLPVVFVADGIQLDLRVLDDGRKVRIVQGQPRKPQPGSADPSKQVAVMIGLRCLDAP